MNEQQFKEEVLTHVNYETAMLNQFFEYWSEEIVKGKDKGKMRWEGEKTWTLKKRLARWQTNNLNWNNGNKINSQSNGSHKPGTSEARISALKEWGK